MLTRLTCPCGASFETEARPGLAVHCPECDSPITVPAPTGTPVRTSGLALASVVVGLVGLFTVVLTIVGLVLGIIALLVIARRREELAGTGYAIFGIVIGLVFTPLSLFAYSKAELFEGLRERLLAPEMDRTGPLEVIRAKDGFAITRPSEKWGILFKPEPEASLMMVQPIRDISLGIYIHTNLNPFQTLENFREDVLNGFRQQAAGPRSLQVSDYRLKYHKRLPNQDTDLEAEEACFDLRFQGNRLTYLVRVLKQRNANQAYVLTGWAMARRFTQIESELRQAQSSFRLLRR